LYDDFTSQNVIKERDAFIATILNVALEYAIGKFQKSQAGLKLYGRHQLLQIISRGD
jgi:hypothetical protein